MKKLESLTLNKFKGLELKKESLNSIHGGYTHSTAVGGGHHRMDTFDNKTAFETPTGDIRWPSKDVQKGRQLD